MTGRRRARFCLLVTLALAGACGDGSAGSAGGEDNASASSAGGVSTVPGDHRTIQSAVDASEPGDLVLIAPGTYHETVIVETDDLVIRGLDRNEVIIDGEFERENGIIVFSDGVAVENLTIRNHTQNGLFFTGDYDSEIVLRGYRAGYVTAHNNGRYGIYGFNATYGLIENSYASGHPESGFYVGQCSPCRTLIVDSIAENNTFGYTGTNASHELYLAANRFVDNRVGVAPHSGATEQLPPQRDSVIVGNVISNNNNPVHLLADRTRDIDAFFPIGVGVWIRGGNDNQILRNRLDDNMNAGVLVEVSVDTDTWIATGNRVVGNSLSGSTLDLVLIVPDVDEGPLGNCFEDNRAVGTQPVDLERLAACGADPAPLGAPATTDRFTTLDVVETSYRDMPVPGPQTQMPDAATAPARPASSLARLDSFDPDSVGLPPGD